MATIVDRRSQDPDSVLFICDFTPPRGPDPRLLEPARELPADFISVAYNPGKSVRAASVLAAHWIKENTDRDVVFTLATRDMNKVATQSLLLGAALLDLQNVVVVKGDEFSERELAAVKAVDDFRPTELLQSVTSLNDGLDYRGGKLRSPTSFCAGATIDLGRGLERQIRLTRRKAEAGAQFFLMQSVFDPLLVREFFEGYLEHYGEELTAPVFCGVQVMTTDSIVFGAIPQWVTDDLEKGRAGEDIAVGLLHRFVEQGIRSIYLVPPILRGGRRDYNAARRVLEGFGR